jgi:mitochondrial fission protein ELM1
MIGDGLPAGTVAWVLGSGRIGHEVHCLGVIDALGLDPVLKPIRTSGFFSSLSPFGPIDPRDAPDRPGSPIAPPFPDIAIASGRKTVPYLRRLRAASAGKTFTVFLEDPRVGAGLADLIWVPEHDRLRGDNVIVTPTTPHSLSPAVLAMAREHPDSRIVALPAPRATMIIGGPSAHHAFTRKDDTALAGVARDLLADGYSVMATASRRSSEATIAALREVFSKAPDRTFFWDGTGDNPYVHMIANADAIVATSDSVNMVGEALATSVPVYLYEPTGGHPKMHRYIDALVARGLARRWNGKIEDWTHEPIDATGVIAAEVARRYVVFRRK